MNDVNVGDRQGQQANAFRDIVDRLDQPSEAQVGFPASDHQSDAHDKDEDTDAEDGTHEKRADLSRPRHVDDRREIVDREKQGTDRYDQLSADMLLFRFFVRIGVRHLILT